MATLSNNFIKYGIKHLQDCWSICYDPVREENISVYLCTIDHFLCFGFKSWLLSMCFKILINQCDYKGNLFCLGFFLMKILSVKENLHLKMIATIKTRWEC